MKAAGEGGGQSLTNSRQRDSGLPCVSERREPEVKRPSTRHHPPGASLPLPAFLQFPFRGCWGFPGNLNKWCKENPVPLLNLFN